ncbi:glycosyltransferase family 2 protein [Pontibacter flavimaris]|uniref:Glycosyltransferase 2-like domain-containing protein n=1 Tax=Pontibacter flavimaris TaxID=1797110 RepID=A0A1Q5PBL1_9BACT|nr:glycosyltransferase family 2 protein [Pontibacter flavimaris]OKL39625.1 hypothetical protein A3841_01400 [Pontibacter flavimaris]
MISNIAGVVVLYNPEEDIIDNVSTYYNSLQKLYVVDNSEVPSEKVLQELSKNFPHTEYHHLANNQGIAKALNIAASRAIEEGFDWLLTMDQDSQASEDMIPKLLEVSANIPKEQVGIIAPRYILETDSLDAEQSNLQEVDVAITSGNLLNLCAFKEVGPFREDFFIDYVDHEYCLRLKLSNYKIVINNKVLLYHKLGDSKSHSFLGYQVNASHHNFLRRYYITRNRLAVLKEFKIQFPQYYRNESTNNLREFIKIILFEKNKVKKIKSVYKGYLDFRRNKFGKYRHN